MKKIEIELYSIGELSKEAQEKALKEYRHINVDGEWWEFRKDEFYEDLEKLGYRDCKLFFSGFYSQGDGACFTAHVDIPAWLKAHKLAKKYQALYRAGDKFSFKITHSGNYYYATSTNVDFEENNFGDASEKENSQAEEVLHLIEKEREELGNKVYKDLQEEYKYQTEDAQVIEFLEANDFLFTKDGEHISNFSMKGWTENDHELFDNANAGGM